MSWKQRAVDTQAWPSPNWAGATIGALHMYSRLKEYISAAGSPPVPRADFKDGYRVPIKKLPCGLNFLGAPRTDGSVREGGILLQHTALSGPNHIGTSHRERRMYSCRLMFRLIADLVVVGREHEAVARAQTVGRALPPCCNCSLHPPQQDDKNKEQCIWSAEQACCEDWLLEWVYRSIDTWGRDLKAHCKEGGPSPSSRARPRRGVPLLHH